MYDARSEKTGESFYIGPNAPAALFVAVQRTHLGYGDHVVTDEDGIAFYVEADTKVNDGDVFFPAIVHYRS